MDPVGRRTHAGHHARPGGRSPGASEAQLTTPGQHGAGRPGSPAVGYAAPPAPRSWNVAGVGEPVDGVFYDMNAPGVINGTPASAGRASVPWSASPVSQGAEGTDTVLSWPDDPRRHDVRHVMPVQEAAAGLPSAGAVAPVAPVLARLPTAAARARYTASSRPAAYSGSTDTADATAAGRRVPPPRAPMELTFVPLRNAAPASSSALHSLPQLTAAQPAQVGIEARAASSGAVPPTGRRAPAAPRSRSPSPKRRTGGNARGAAGRAPAAVPVTLELLAGIVSSRFRGVEGKLGKIQKSVDGVSAVVSTHAEKFNSMAVLAESVTAAQSATATADAEMRVASERTIAAAQGGNAGTSQKSAKMGAQEQRIRDRQEANAVKVRFLSRECRFVREMCRRPSSRA